MCWTSTGRNNGWKGEDHTLLLLLVTACSTVVPQVGVVYTVELLLYSATQQTRVTTSSNNSGAGLVGTKSTLYSIVVEENEYTRLISPG